MMDFKCIIGGCSTNPRAYCTCRQDFVFICPNHIVQHFDDNETLKHASMPMYRRITIEEKNQQISIYTSLYDSIKRIEDSISNCIVQVINAFTKLQNKYTKYFMKQKTFIEKMIEIVSKEEKKLIVPGYESQDFDHKGFMVYLEQMLVTLQPFCMKCVEEAEVYTKDLQSYKRFFLSIDKDREYFLSNGNLNEHVYFFKKGTKTFIEFNTHDLTYKESQIQVNENQGALAGICQLPGRKLFYTGGYDPNLDSTYIIDLISKTVEILPKCRQRACASATYYADSVYLFGGITDILIFSDRFDLKTRKWVNLANLPIALRDTSALVCRGFFIISNGYQNCLYRYNLNRNNYETLAVVNSSPHNVLIRDKGNYFYLAGASVFTSFEQNLQAWTKHNKNLTINSYETTCKPVTKGRNVYFNSYNIVYRFNMDDITIVEVKKFN
ncbi:hypothetical protein SteCoe_7443 [Stentor coeruleus]|uniref:Kelch motif family protein n=1 Tax=Stentor coeruleus TaxID=5963 RepID=A0A1R2CMM3_9CILI|nr:hypothetical protein SteCoe_7443 [Stentor coeruleus]